jgi:hypothetical protein
VKISGRRVIRQMGRGRYPPMDKYDWAVAAFLFMVWCWIVSGIWQ